LKERKVEEGEEDTERGDGEGREREGCGPLFRDFPYEGGTAV
jgi:hypothetical protein